MTDTVLAGGDRDAAARTPPRAADTGRSVRRRQSLPTGRAVVGGFLVALAALGIFLAYARVTAEPATRYVVARHDLRVGAQVLPGDVALLPMDLPRAVIDRKVVFTSAAGVAGATVLAPVRAGELVQASDLVRKGSGEGDVEISFPIDASRAVAGELAAGEKVLARSWGRPATDAEITPYWADLIDANRDRLADRNNPDLLFAGQVMVVPPPPPAPR